MLLDVRNLTTHFFLDEGVLRAVDGVSFQVEDGQTVAIVGESGCGKTIVALSLLDLAPSPARIVRGEIRFEDRDILTLPPEEVRRVRGGGIGMVFQEPAAALNPVHTIGRQIADVVRLHRGLGKTEAWQEAVRLLGEMGIPEPDQRANAYPHELSGGMQQRATIAIAVSARPRLLIADEPTTALDATVRAEILVLLLRLRDEHGMALLIITHDINVVERVADRVLVMYTGRIVESGPCESVMRSPRHPYTQGLLASRLRLGVGRTAPLEGIPGSVPDLMALPRGCTFHPRCRLADAECETEFPSLDELGHGRQCACYKVHDGATA